ncbi:hypothetical protein KUF71_025382 [Frankliniella fusca]|uniref:Uncharacterized protein n=1 Tax=Frankliniella fusca TaxID=407009 RepID=A0AAE1I139_9NEOP|nr:hypothetical protein KUF71_025382 [Frankliniella fusca]
MMKNKVQKTKFTLNNTDIPVLEEGDSYQHLGVPTGARVDQTPRDLLKSLTREATLICNSLLAPWQKLHAIRTFTLSQIDFALRTAKVEKTAFKELDNLIKKEAKKTPNLPQRASAEPVFLPPCQGEAGLIPLSDLSDLCTVSHAFRLLTCPDPVVQETALSGVRVTTKRKIKSEPTLQQICQYLSGNKEDPFNREDGSFSTLWTSARTAMTRTRKNIPDMKWAYLNLKNTFEIQSSALISDELSGIRKIPCKEIRIGKTIPFQQLSDQRPPQEVQSLKPDIVVINEATRTIDIIDITVPFENSVDALEVARQKNTWTVRIDAFVVGALGSWLNSNNQTMKILGLTTAYANTLARLACSTAIHWSRDIYVEHISGRQQYQED